MTMPDSAFPAHDKISVKRRELLEAGAKLGFLALCLTSVGALVKNIRYLIPGSQHQDAQSFKAGAPAEYAMGSVDGRWKQSQGVWLVRTLEGFYGVSAKTELGEPVEWDHQEQVFRSGDSVFYKSGVYFAGPRRKSLTRTAVRLSEEGVIFVDPSKKFRQEKGEWVRSASFLVLGKNL